MKKCASIETKSEMADMLERFFDRAPAENHATGWEWDDFENSPFKDAALEAWRQRVLREIGHIVAPSRGEYFDKIADDRISAIIAGLRNNEDA